MTPLGREPMLGAVALWPWLTSGGGVAVLLGAAVLLLIAMLGAVWLSRARAARRFNAAVDAYAEREIDRERRRKTPPRVRRPAFVVSARRQAAVAKGRAR